MAIQWIKAVSYIPNQSDIKRFIFAVYRSLSANNAALAKSLQRVQKKNKKLTHLVNTQNLMLHVIKQII